jgi:hypothetical protein
MVAQISDSRPNKVILEIGEAINKAFSSLDSGSPVQDLLDKTKYFVKFAFLVI